MTHLLDTSAILAHYLDEPGAQTVEEILAQGPEIAAIAAPSWVELHARLGELLADAEADRVFRLYTRNLCGLIPLDEPACLAAIRLRTATPKRLPLVDALIAGCAAANGLTLVHRDPHFDHVPRAELDAVRLPEKPRAHPPRRG